MRKLLIATHNQAKLDEIKTFLHRLLPHLEILSLKDLNVRQEPKETGKTFEENAKLKAEYYARLTNLPAIADDGGLMITALNDEPGVYSSRWMGRPGTAQELIDYCLSRMKNIPDGKRNARFETCLYFYNPSDEKSFCETGTVEGTIAKKAHREVVYGYQYRSVFIVTKFNKYYLDLTPEEHKQINHRYTALKQLALVLKNWYN